MRRILCVEDAMNAILAAVNMEKKTEEILLIEALHRVASEDVYASINQPPFDRSPLDGYAVRHQDIQAASEKTPAVLTVNQRIYAGDVPQKGLQEGEAAVIMTGAPSHRGQLVLCGRRILTGDLSW